MTTRLLFAIACALAGCCQRNDAKPNHATQPCRPPEVETFLDANEARYRDSIVRAKQWLDELAIDPIELRKHQVKGKKKLTEQLDAYYRLVQVAEAAQRAALIERVKQVVAITYEPRFHDLATVTDGQFKQDATSYLRAAVLMERLGLDTQLYREEIKNIQPRLDAHMRIRGAHQRLALHWYYDHFGLMEPFPLAMALDDGLIARRANPSKFSSSDVYGLTHEVFIPYEYGEKLDADPFTEAEKAYLRPTLALLLAHFIIARDADLAAELVSCMRMLRFVDEPVYREGLDFLLEHQREDGAWGDLERAERTFGDRGREAVILHTTMVVVDALTLAFHRPWNPRRGCE